VGINRRHERREDRARPLIGANTLIAEGKEIPDGVLVSWSPGKIIRELNQTDRDYLLTIATGYVERSRFYKENLKKIT